LCIWLMVQHLSLRFACKSVWLIANCTIVLD